LVIILIKKIHMIRKFKAPYLKKGALI
jgi:hypothetical protein